MDFFNRRRGLRRSPKHGQRSRPIYYEPRPTKRHFYDSFRERSHHPRSHSRHAVEPTLPKRTSSRHYPHHPQHPEHSRLTNLPPEIQLGIFENLDSVDSTVLGLSSRRLYPLHRSKHGKVGLYEQKSGNVPLVFRMGGWAPEGMVLDEEQERFVRRDDGYRERRHRREREDSEHWDGRVRDMRWERERRLRRY